MKLSQIIKHSITLSLLLLTPAVWAQQTNVDYSQFDRDSALCPKPEDLVRNDKQIWYVPHSDWRSYSPSFTQKIDYFIGAQWQGVVVGRVMICRYSGAETDFPVNIQMTNRLIPKPKGEHWNKGQNGDETVKNCVPKSHNVRDCPFSVLIEKKQGDLLDQIKYYREDQ